MWYEPQLMIYVMIMQDVQETLMRMRSVQKLTFLRSMTYVNTISSFVAIFKIHLVAVY